MKPQTVTEYVKHVTDVIDMSSLQDLRILHRWQCGQRGGMMVIGKPNGSSVYRCEITLTPSGHLILTGDLDTVCWARFSGESLERAITWIGREQFSMYCSEKASIGMGHKLEKYVPEIALMDVEDNIENARSDENEEAVEIWEEIREMITEYDENIEEIRQAIYDKTGDCEAVDIGMAPSPTLIWGWGYLRNVRRLLESEVSHDRDD